MKILMIGNQNSGKTTYMASAFSLLSGGVKDFFIKTDEQTTLWFNRLFEMIKGGEYPAPTDKRNRFEFELYHKFDKVLDFEWIDYNGGIINTESVAQLKEDIKNADGLMIFLESKALLMNNFSTHKFSRILKLIHEHLEQSERPLLSVIIVLTKYDLIPRDAEFGDVMKGIDSFVVAAKENDQLYARAVPVSITDQGFYNVELPLLDELDSGLLINYAKARFQAEACINEAMAKADEAGLIDKVVSFVFSEPTYEEIALVYLEKAKEQIALYEALETPLGNLRQFINDYKIKLPGIDPPTLHSKDIKPKHNHIEF